MEMLFFDHIDKLGRIVLTTVVVYVLIILFTKVSGKRSTSQLNNFDWIVTVMIGSLSARRSCSKTSQLSRVCLLSWCSIYYNSWSPNTPLFHRNLAALFYLNRALFFIKDSFCLTPCVMSV